MEMIIFGKDEWFYYEISSDEFFSALFEDLSDDTKNN